MAKGTIHSKSFSIVLPLFIIILVYLRLYFFIPLLFLSNTIVDPDQDTKWKNGKYHRSFITHSVLWSVLIGLVWSFSLLEYFDLSVILLHFMKVIFVFLLPILLHLILDVYSKSGNRTGKYCISFQNEKRLTGRLTVIWILVNITLILLYIVGFIWLQLIGGI